jgi:hypothetical protein
LKYLEASTTSQFILKTIQQTFHLLIDISQGKTISVSTKYNQILLLDITISAFESTRTQDGCHKLSVSILIFRSSHKASLFERAKKIVSDTIQDDICLIQTLLFAETSHISFCENVDCACVVILSTLKDVPLSTQSTLQVT